MTPIFNPYTKAGIKAGEQAEAARLPKPFSLQPTTALVRQWRGGRRQTRVPDQWLLAELRKRRVIV